MESTWNSGSTSTKRNPQTASIEHRKFEPPTPIGVDARLNFPKMEPTIERQISLTFNSDFQKAKQTYEFQLPWAANSELQHWRVVTPSSITS